MRRKLRLPLKASSLASLKHRCQRGVRKWQALLGWRPGVATKGAAAAKACPGKAKARHPPLTGVERCVQVWERFALKISLNRLNELLHQAGSNNAPGRPPKRPAEAFANPGVPGARTDLAGSSAR